MSRKKYSYLLLQLFKEMCKEEEGIQHCSKNSPQCLSITQMMLEFISLHPSEQCLAIIYTLCIHPRSLTLYNSMRTFSQDVLSVTTRSTTSATTTCDTTISSSTRALNHQIIQRRLFEKLIQSIEADYQSSFFPSIDQAVSFILRLISIAICTSTPDTRRNHITNHLHEAPNIDAIRMLIQKFQDSALCDGTVTIRTQQDEKNSYTTTTSSPHNQQGESIMHTELELPSLMKEAARYTTGGLSSALDLACQYSDNPAFIAVMIDASLTTTLSSNVKSRMVAAMSSASTSQSALLTSADESSSYVQLSLLDCHDPSWLCGLLLCVTNNDYNEYYDADLTACAPTRSSVMKIISSISSSLIYRKDTDICARAFNYKYGGFINHLTRSVGRKQSNYDNYQASLHNNNGRRQQEEEGEEEEEENMVLASSWLTSYHKSTASTKSNYSNMIMLDFLEKAATSGHTETLVALLTINPHLILQRNVDTHHMLLQTTVLNFRYESNQRMLANYFLPEHEWSRRIEFILQEGMKYQITDKNISPYLVGGLFAVDSHIDGILEEMTHLLGKEKCWQMITTCLNQYSYEDAPILHAAIGKSYQDTIKEILKHFKTSAFLRDRSRDLALHVAIKRGMKWNNGLCDILYANRLAATTIEFTSGLPSCVLAALGGRDDGTSHSSRKVELKSVYELFRVALRKRDFDIRQIIAQ